MITITAILRAKPGAEAELQAALLAVTAHVRAAEPGTIDFFVSRDAEAPAVFTTYERFRDRAAMDKHNHSASVAAFFAAATPILDGPVILHICDEVSTKR
ncbi:putative quinol monooxygenase [Inquilinus sp. NPDC058860]|uniref:putative quinol monooxygenase n=1 Tax=Inquilinus sp. NPDC058860 TaxID=3346652 RepID=UPI003682C8A9